ncbi:uncharacterized protein TRAVEDRAFT_32463, partial [Trametes versicolor FP-101664 SS1]
MVPGRPCEGRCGSLLFTTQPPQNAEDLPHVSDVVSWATCRLSRPQMHSYACASRSAKALRLNAYGQGVQGVQKPSLMGAECVGAWAP